jgi:hypothetical protein
MRKIIDGKVYDTSPVELIAEYTHEGQGDIRYLSVGLYRTRKGTWFTVGRARATDRLAPFLSDHCDESGDVVEVIEATEARQFLEVHAKELAEKHVAVERVG